MRVTIYSFLENCFLLAKCLAHGQEMHCCFVVMEILLTLPDINPFLF